MRAASAKIYQAALKDTLRRCNLPHAKPHRKWSDPDLWATKEKGGNIGGNRLFMLEIYYVILV